MDVLFGLVLVVVIVAVVFAVQRRIGGNRTRSLGGPPPSGYPPPTAPTAWGNPHATYSQPAPTPPPADQDAYDALRANPYGTAQPGGATARPEQSPPPPGDLPPGWGGRSSRS